MYTHDTPKTYSKSFATAFRVTGIALALVSPRAEAQWTREREMAMLPDYCRPEVQANADEVARYRSLLGPTFGDLHHYCYGLTFTNRAKLSRMTSQDRNFALTSSIGEFDYVISRAPADFVLLPEILTKKGENLLQLRRIREAVSTLQRAIETKPDYWPPYAVLSDYFKQNGDLDKAREWLEKGIAAAPDAKALVTRQAELKSKR